jgi:hypothetical protein
MPSSMVAGDDVFHSEAASCTPLLIRVDPGPSSSLNLDFSHFLSILQSPQCFLQPCCNSKAPHCAGQSNASVWHRLVHSDGTVFQKIRGICLFGSSSPRSTQMTPLSDGEHPQANAAPPPASSDLQGASLLISSLTQARSHLGRYNLYYLVVVS